MAEGVRTFMDREVLPCSEELESGDTGVLLELFQKASELGLTGIEIPERLGGLGLDLTTAMLASAEVSRQASFSTSIGAHFGIGTLPLVLFGTEELKSRYLPELARAERIGAYALTESEAGSDALGVRSRAVRQADGDWLLDGEKQLITNGGIAGLYTVFAKVDGEAFTAFLVPAERPGVVAGPPEKKMGLKGSPTASLRLDSVRVPADHVLGEVGAGHRVAFNILNIGRMKLGFGSLAYGREALRLAASYAAERRQFGKPICEFQVIRTKLAEMAARLFSLEGAAFRTARSMDDELPAGLGDSPIQEAVRVLKAHAVEGAAVKVLGSETVGFVADEALQVHGGYGFIEDYPVCRIYRDVRINRLFEGTSEINRLLIAGSLFKRGPFDPFFRQLRKRGKVPGPAGEPGAEALCEGLRWLIGRFAGAAMKLRRKLETEQVVLSDLADLIIDLYALDTACARRAGSRQSGDGARSAALVEAQLELVAEATRARAIERTLRLATRLRVEPAHRLVAPLAAGTKDTRQAVDRVAASVLEGRL